MPINAALHEFSRSLSEALDALLADYWRSLPRLLNAQSTSELVGLVQEAEAVASDFLAKGAERAAQEVASVSLTHRIERQSVRNEAIRCLTHFRQALCTQLLGIKLSSISKGERSVVQRIEQFESRLESELQLFVKGKILRSVSA